MFGEVISKGNATSTVSPVVTCECGAETIFDWSQAEYRFVCRDCQRLVEGLIPPLSPSDRGDAP